MFAEMVPINEKKFKMLAIANINPKVKYLPNWVLNFFARKVNNL
jgi:hypothetical protein